MSLFIISQNKNIIKKVNDYLMIEEQISVNVNNPNTNTVNSIITGYNIVVDNVPLGKYATKQNADKVITEIQSLLASKNVGKGKDAGDNLSVKHSNNNCIYELPKDTPPAEK